MTMHYLLIVCLTIGLTASAEISKDAIQKAYFETFAVRLNDGEAVTDSDSLSSANSAEQTFPSISDLPPFPGYQWLTIDYIGWEAVVLTAVACLGGIAVSSLLRFRRRWNAPQAVRLRQARGCLRSFARPDRDSSSQAVTETITGALRTISGTPPGASLSAVAERLTPQHPELAAACRALEQTRFSGSNTTAETAAIAAMKRALRIGIPCLLCLLAGCEGITQFAWYSDWSHGRQLASQGRLPEAAAVFEKLTTVMPSCEALSETMAKLRTAVPPSHGDTADAWRLHAKILHDSRLFSRRYTWLNHLPELALPGVTAAVLIGLYACLRRRRCLAAILLLLALIQSVSTAFPLSQRLSTGSQAIALAELKRTPDSDGEPLTAAAVTPVQLLSTTADTRFYRVQSTTSEGWLPASRLLFYIK